MTINTFAVSVLLIPAHAGRRAALDPILHLQDTPPRGASAS
jgi:hypothetical protein